MLAKNVMLIGFQASGKTTFGRLLAKQLNRPFIDTDDLIQQYHPSLSCREIYRTFSKDYFRRLEAEVVAGLEHTLRGAVIATGGGCLMNESNGYSLKKHSHVIYLEVSFEVLKERILTRTFLPSYLDKGDPENSLKHLYEERSAIYEKWADQILTIQQEDMTQTLKRLYEMSLSLQDALNYQG